MKFFKNYNQLFLIPSICFTYEFDLTKPWILEYLFIDLMWLKWGLEITIKKEKYA